MKLSPAKNEARTKGTTRSTLGLSVGFRTRAGSTRKPRAWAYSIKAWLNRGFVGSASLDDGAHVVGDNDAEDALKKGPRRFEAVDDGLGALAEAEPDKTVPGVARR